MTGPVAFDEFGDTTTKVLTVYKVVEASECGEEAATEEEEEGDTTTTAGEEDEDATTTTGGGAAAGGDAPCWQPEKTDEFGDAEAGDGGSASSTTETTE